MSFGEDYFHHVLSRVCTIDMVYHCGQWPWPPAEVMFDRFLYCKVTCPPRFHTALFGRKLLCAVHTWGVGCYALKLNYLDFLCIGECSQDIYCTLWVTLYYYTLSLLLVLLQTWPLEVLCPYDLPHRCCVCSVFSYFLAQQGAPDLSYVLPAPA